MRFPQSSSKALIQNDLSISAANLKWHPPCFNKSGSSSQTFSGIWKIDFRKSNIWGEGALHLMNRTSLKLTLMLAATMVASLGCSTKNYVRQQTTPLINKTNELDDMTAKNSKDIKDVDQRAQAGIQGVQARTAEVDQKALAAGSEADKAQMAANGASQRVDVLTNAVVNLDNYRPVVETAVHFGFNKDNLTKDAREAIDQLAASVATTKGYIITVEGATDSVGTSEYNYDLSQRRANAVIQYLAAEKSVPAYKIYLIGLGKDKPVETNKTRDGRAKNRRVDIRLMTNTGEGTTPAQTPKDQTPTANATPPSL
jgi:outer membrane protein OmpA-like peptidoglycan-associated protein